ncbi:outer membrane lipoprotein [Tichowtungia aerotolerans]|uniref:Glycine zipper 2TM domain-containing protein n=1 Tax=Tichowtungia aerotolerans TaxID=2697043 RepID=A0A6P1M243_9BACT|nr:glycine zipper 2TM domain-containing protein [Tichowtungia aerotolerans]QHI68182.1 glycine zipper 2TM domain-containing protein [Tichowtungia aerotolerans]
MKTLGIITGLTVVALATGCVSSKSGEVYSRDQARQSMTVRLGTVEFVKEVLVEGSKSGLGAAAGGIAGGVAGSTIGGGKGSTLAALGGAALGALAGHAAEEKLTKFNGLEITVKLDNGDVLAVVQEDDVMFAVGDRVRVLTGRDGTTRVEK